MYELNSDLTTLKPINYDFYFLNNISLSFAKKQINAETSPTWLPEGKRTLFFNCWHAFWLEHW